MVKKGVSKEDKIKGVEEQILQEVEAEVAVEKPKIEAMVKKDREEATKTKPKKKEKLLDVAKKTIAGRKGKKEEKKEVKKLPSKIFTIPLKKRVSSGIKARTAVKDVRLFVQKNMKTDVVISQEVNEAIWKRGKKKPPSKIRVSVEQDEDGRAVVKLR